MEITSVLTTLIFLSLALMVMCCLLGLVPKLASSMKRLCAVIISISLVFVLILVSAIILIVLLKMLGVPLVWVNSNTLIKIFM